MALTGIKKLFKPIINYLGEKKFDIKFNDKPIIIGACGRSGTTLLLSILGAHSNIYTFPYETAAFIDWYKDGDDYLPRIDRLYRYALTHSISNDCNRWCEKSPSNVLKFGKILNYFGEEVRLIHIIRDGRDVMLSKHPTAPDEYWVSPERWVNDVKAGLEFKDHPQVLTIKYEDLILSYQKTINQICDFIGEEATSELNNWFKNTNIKDSNAWFEKAQQIHSKSIEKWKKEENKERVEEVMQHEEVVDLLEELDYL
ncbi:MAG: sulfotransferase family protein [Bacillota bacterium]